MCKRTTESGIFLKKQPFLGGWTQYCPHGLSILWWERAFVSSEQHIRAEGFSEDHVPPCRLFTLGNIYTCAEESNSREFCSSYYTKCYFYIQQVNFLDHFHNLQCNNTAKVYPVGVQTWKKTWNVLSWNSRYQQSDFSKYRTMFPQSVMRKPCALHGKNVKYCNYVNLLNDISVILPRLMN